jgi:dihydropyrimidinase
LKTLLKNGTIVTAEVEYEADILLNDDKIEAIGQNLDASADEIVDVKGKYVLPGGVDQHVHYSFEFNGEMVKGFETSNAAAVGGTTTVIEFVNQEKDHGLIETMEDYKENHVAANAMVDYSFHPVITDAREEVIEEVADLSAYGTPTVKLFMAYKGMFFHSNDETIAKTLRVAKDHGVTVMVHAENADLIDLLQKEEVSKGNTDPYYHATSRPPLVETEATERAINIAKVMDAPLYVVHVTTEGAGDAIKEAQEAGFPIYGETCVQYLTLTKDDLARENFEGAKYVLSPALRDEMDQDYLWNAIDQGWLNAVSTDHCGFDFETQKVMGKDDFRNIPNGAPGVEDRLGVLWTAGVESGKLSRSQLVDLFATKPALNNGIGHKKGHLAPGYDADIVVYDPNESKTISAETSLQGTDYNTFEGFEQKGKTDKVFLRGTQIVDNGEYIGEKGQGEFVKGEAYGLAYDKVKA